MVMSFVSLPLPPPPTFNAPSLDLRLLTAYCRLASGLSRSTGQASPWDRWAMSYWPSVCSF